MGGRQVQGARLRHRGRSGQDRGLDLLHQQGRQRRRHARQGYRGLGCGDQPALRGEERGDRGAQGAACGICQGLDRLRRVRGRAGAGRAGGLRAELRPPSGGGAAADHGEDRARHAAGLGRAPPGEEPEPSRSGRGHGARRPRGGGVRLAVGRGPCDARGPLEEVQARAGGRRGGRGQSGARVLTRRAAPDEHHREGRRRPRREGHREGQARGRFGEGQG
mmetsp:Transcript_1420/g.3819  ORF Transcript_1420/g.3819 Transcript_1420/m.3819 type:complete len:220 (-) Transcript_1420:475-1134(-)